MPAPAADRRPACPRCVRPLSACVCAWVVPTANRIPVLVLQHPAEAGHAKNSVRLLRLGLQHCRVEAGAALDAATLAGWLDVPGGSVLLYPDRSSSRAPARIEDRHAGESPAVRTPHFPGQLVLLDGTWRQSRVLLRGQPQLAQLPRLTLQATPPSVYEHRRAHSPEQRSTLEAACLALGDLEGRPAHYAPMLAAFAGWAAAEQARAAVPTDGTVTRRNVRQPLTRAP